MIAEVKQIYEMNARQVVEQMRQAADNIEKGNCTFDVRGAILIIAGRTRSVDVYSWGDLDNFSTLGVLERATRHVHESIEG